MIIGHNTVSHLAVHVQVTDTNGAAASADAGVTASFYRVDPSTGNTSLDLVVGTSGTLAMTASVPGLYTCSVPLSQLLHVQYIVRFTWAVSGQQKVSTTDLVLLPELDTISRNAVTPDASTVRTSMVR